jgi:putative flippase GtrA
MAAASVTTRREPRLLGEVARFLAVGGVATLTSVVGFNVLAHGFLLGRAPLGAQPLVAFVVANAVAGVLAYVGMRTWAFAHRGGRDSTSGLLRFFVLGGVTMAIPVLCLWFSRYALGLTSPWADNVSANVVGLSLGAAARFWVFRRFVFDDVAITEPRLRLDEG